MANKYQTEAVSMMYYHKMVTVRDCKKYNFHGYANVYVREVKVVDGEIHIIGDTCKGEEFDLTVGVDNFCRWYPNIRSPRT